MEKIAISKLSDNDLFIITEKSTFVILISSQ